MRKTLGTIRHHYMRLLTHEVCVLHPSLQEMLTQQTRRLSERQVRVCVTRWMISMGVSNGIVYHMTLSTTTQPDELIPMLARSAYTPDEVMRLLLTYSHWYNMQRLLYQALAVVPEDVASRVHLSASGDGFVWDAAPLLGLLTEDDLKELLGDPDAVRAWLRRHHQLPETERPAGTLPADLRSPRDVCDLLLNPPLLTWVLWQSVPETCSKYQTMAYVTRETITPRVSSAKQEAREQLYHAEVHWTDLAGDLHTKLGMDLQTALRTARRVSVETLQLCGDPETFAEHRRTCRSIFDPWQLKPFMVGSSSRDATP